MRRIVAFLAWFLGSVISGSLLLGLIVMVSRTDRFAWLAFALAVGVALILKFWPRTGAFVRWLIASLYALFYLTFQVGPWMHVGYRVGVNRQFRQLADLFERHYYAAHLLAMGLIAGLLIIAAYRDRKRPWLSVWLMLALACGLLVVQFSGPNGAANDFAARLASFLHISGPAAEAIVVAGRKAIHFGFYGLFALFSVRAALCAGATGSTAVGSGFGFALMHAVFDESRQVYSPGRTGSPWDVLLDVAGMAFFVFLLNRSAMNRTFRKPGASKSPSRQ